MRICVVFCCLLSASVQAAANELQRAWTVADSIQLSYFASTERDWGSQSITNAEVTPSPDKRRFFVIRQRGDLVDDSQVYTRDVFAVRAVEDALLARGAAPKPLWTYTIRSRDAQQPGIFDVRWTDDSSAISFLGAKGSAPRQVMRWDMATGEVSTLTAARLGVQTYSLRGDWLVFSSVVDDNVYRSRDLKQYPLTLMRQPDWAAALGWRKRAFATFIRRPDGRIHQLGEARSDGGLGVIYQQVFISPDGKYLIMPELLSGTKLPSSWEEYQGKALGSFVDVARFVIVDLRTLRKRVIVDAPTGNFINNLNAPGALWFPDSRRVILTNTMLPLRLHKTGRRHSTYMIEYDVETSEYHVIDDMPVASDGRRYPPSVTVSWKVPGGEFIASIVRNGRNESISYRKGGGRWIRKETVESIHDSASSRFGNGVSVSIVQTLNEPPRLVASNGSFRLQLSPTDPVLRNVKRLPASLISWMDRRGYKWDGVLVLPAAEERRGGFPLIVQLLHSVESGFFLPDGGSYMPGYAAQAMAARGFAVLSLDTRGGKEMVLAKPEEGPNIVAGIDSAVTHLQSQGLVNANRVGLIGYSRTGYSALYAATHPRSFIPAAAIMQDSFDASYGQYLFVGALSPDPSPSANERLGYEGQYAGGGSFWANKQAWLSDAPGFNLNRMETPLLMTSHYGEQTASLFNMMEVYGGLRLRRRPVEVAVYPEGSHVLKLPRQRQAAMQLGIDWMEFWLNGEECRDIMHADRTMHWRDLRDRWKQARKEEGLSDGGVRQPDHASASHSLGFF